MRAGLIVFAGAAAVSVAALAEHPGRPENLPPKGSADLYFFDHQGNSVGFESGAPGAGAIFVYGWSFDGNDPNSPFVSGSPAAKWTNEPMFNNHPWLYAYNSSTFTFDRINVEFLKVVPNALVGPSRIAMFDFSRLKVTDSILRGVLISASEFSDLEFSNSQISGELRMQSGGSLKLSGVTPFERPGDPLPSRLSVIHGSGTTDIASSTLDGIVARGRGSVTVTNSTIRSGVSTDRGDLHATFVPLVTLADTQVASLSASIGSITMTGGRVNGIVNASGVADDPLRAGRISLDGVVVGGSVSASKFGSLFVKGGSIGGNVTAGDASGAPADIKIFSSDVAGNLQAVGSGKLKVALFQSIGSLQASGDSRVELSSGNTIRGGVLATGKSQVDIVLVDKIEGDAFADQGARLSLDLNSNQVVGAVGAFSEARLKMSGGRALSVTADGGDVELHLAKIAEQIVVFGKSNLTFSLSEVGHSITNFGDGTGMVRLESGKVGGDLVGLGSSVTAMSGGIVEGSPVFGEQATFLYSGGTFFFRGTTPPDPPEEGLARVNGDGGAGSLDLLSTSSGFTALSSATIKFIGFGLQSTLVDADHLEGDLHYSVYQLTGLLADHSSIDGGLVFIQNAAGTAGFELIEARPVPEPSLAALWVIGLSTLAWSCRARRATRARRSAAFA